MTQKRTFKPNFLRQKIKEKGYKLSFLAEKAGIKPYILVRYHNVYCKVSGEDLMKLGFALDLSLEEMKLLAEQHIITK